MARSRTMCSASTNLASALKDASHNFTNDVCASRMDWTSQHAHERATLKWNRTDTTTHTNIEPWVGFAVGAWNGSLYGCLAGPKTLDASGMLTWIDGDAAALHPTSFSNIATNGARRSSSATPSGSRDNKRNRRRCEYTCADRCDQRKYAQARTRSSTRRSTSSGTNSVAKRST